jgi:hypothetical protein
VLTAKTFPGGRREQERAEGSRQREDGSGLDLYDIVVVETGLEVVRS